MDQTIQIGDKAYVLRFPARTQVEIERHAGEVLGQPKLKFTLNDLLKNAIYTEVQIYLLMMGIKGGDRLGQKDLTMEQAGDLRDTFMAAETPDNGSRYRDFQDTIARAVADSFGADPLLMLKEQQAENLLQMELAKQRAAAILTKEKEIEAETARLSADPGTGN